MEQNDLSIIGKRIRELRNEKKLSQSELGKVLSVSQDTVSLWEKSKSLPSVEMIIDICNFFGVTSDYLLGRTDY